MTKRLLASRQPFEEEIQLIEEKINDRGLDKRSSVCGNNSRIFWMLSTHLKEDDTRKDTEVYLLPTGYDDNEGELLNMCDMEDNCEVKLTKSGKYTTSFHLPKCLHGSIVGQNGSTLRDIQDKTGASVSIPTRNTDSSIVIIKAATEKSVYLAKSYIDIIAIKRRNAMRVTHFFSISLAQNDGIRKNYESFRDAIIKDSVKSRGIDNSVFQSADRLHITLLVVTLLDQVEQECAQELINLHATELLSGFVGKPAPVLTVHGLDIMNDDPSEAHVLYGIVKMDNDDHLEKLQHLVNTIKQLLNAKGLIKDDLIDLKLHATLMNSGFRREAEAEQAQNNTRPRETFDATDILNRYRDYYFGKMTLETIDLCVRGEFNPDNGNYKSIASLKLV